RDGWLFYAANTPGAGTPAENHAGILNDDSNRIFTHIKQRLEETQKYFADEGIRYLFVVAPDKWSIYPEYLPAAHDAKGNDPIALQLVQYLRENSSVEVLDLREALLAAKGQTWPVYRQGDTHWSDLGAFHGSAEILKTVAPHYPVMKPLSLDQYALSEIQTDALDLVNMMGLKGLLKEKTVQLTPQQSPGPQIITTDKPGMHPVYTQQNNRALPSALILRDSYANAMIPFLSTGFSRAQYIWTTNTRGHGLEFKAGQDRPDIIIEMKVERYAMHLHKYFQARIQQTQ
ncbi:MAG: alginate O-acetyltransferase complex protein AlgJ, partial [Candidatus Krumholzibacteriia bacterium]